MSRHWFLSRVDGPWEGRIELARRGVATYGKPFARKAGLVLDLTNYRQDGYDFDARYENVLGAEVTRGAYDRSPEESKARIMEHLGLLCPETFDDDLEKLIR